MRASSSDGSFVCEALLERDPGWSLTGIDLTLAAVLLDWVSWPSHDGISFHTVLGDEHERDDICEVFVSGATIELLIKWGRFNGCWTCGRMLEKLEERGDEFTIGFVLDFPEHIAPAVTEFRVECCWSKAGSNKVCLFSREDTIACCDGAICCTLVDWISGLLGEATVLGVGEAVLDTIAVFLVMLKVGEFVRYTSFVSTWPLPRLGERVDAIEDTLISDEGGRVVELRDSVSVTARRFKSEDWLMERGRMLTDSLLSTSLWRRERWQIIWRQSPGSSRQKSLWWKAPASGPLVTWRKPQRFSLRVKDGYLHELLLVLFVLEADSGK